MCPKWALDVSRFDVLRQVNVQYEFQLAELLPLAPTAQRSSNLWTAYHPPSRVFTVAVQDYPGVGLDTFFQVTINADVTAAQVKVSNVIMGHPDGVPGNPGSLTLQRVVADNDGQILVLFSDGSLHRVDFAQRSYAKVADVLGGSITSDDKLVLTVAHVVDTASNALKSIAYAPATSLYYVVSTDLSTFAVSTPVQLVPAKGKLGPMSIIAAHMMLEPNTNVRQLAVVYAGSFDWIAWVNEATGEQTELVSDLYEASSTSPCEFECYEGAKDCDTKWATSAYDGATNTLYFQTHQVEGDLSSAYIYQVQFLQNRATKVFSPYVQPDVLMTFGYSGYQWVSFQ